MVLRCQAPQRALRPTQLPRVASFGLVAAAAASPFASAAPALAAPAGGALGTSPLATTPLPAAPVATTPVPTTPMPTTPVTTSRVTRWVTVGANVRSGPGTGYAVVGGLPQGAEVTGTATANGWFDLGEGRFVAGSLLTATDPGDGDAPSPAPSTETRWVLSDANVRSGPGTGYAVVGGLARGAKVTGSPTSNGWFDLGGGRFVYGSLLTATDPGGAAPTPSPSPSVETRWITTGANVRSGPGTSYRVVGTLAQGTRVEGSATANNWFDLGGGRFVYGPLTTTTPPTTPAPPPVTPPATVTRYATTTANVRAGAGTGYAVVGTVVQGAQVTGTYTSNNWLDMGGGRFVAGWLLTDVAPGQPAPAPAPGEVTGAMLLAEAQKYTGTPYLWGGSTPAGFDCSGLTSYVFAQFGIALPRTAAMQKNWALPVSDPRPGDLIFFGSPAYHVGIYAGNGMMFDSPRPGMYVGMRQIWNTGDISYGRVPGVTS